MKYAGTIADQLRALYRKTLEEPLGEALERAFANLGALDPRGPGAGDCVPDGGDTADPVALLERRVVASREG